MYGYVPSIVPAEVSGSLPGEAVDRASEARTRLKLRQPEVEQLRARLRQHHVTWFQISVHDSASMSVSQGISQFGRVAHHVGGRQRTARKPLG